MKQKTLIISLFIITFLLSNVLNAQCPKMNKIQKLTSTMASFKDVQPLDFTKIVSAGAYSNKAGTRLQVCMSNTDFPVDKMANNFVVPIKSKSQWIAVVNFSNANKPIVKGKYSAASGYGKPFWAYAEIKVFKGEKNTIVSLGVVEGVAEIIEISEDNVCGIFNLKNKKGDSGIIGKFNMKLTKSRW